MPKGFDPALTGSGSPGRCEVVADGTAEGGKALAQVSADPTNYRFPLLIHGPIVPADLEASVRFQALSGKVDQTAGIAVRLADKDNYYVVRANALEGNVRLYRMVAGKREQFAGTDIKVTAGEWHTLALRAKGNQFAVSYDGKELFTAKDDRFRSGGKVALWTKADSVTRCLLQAAEGFATRTAFSTPLSVGGAPGRDRPKHRWSRRSQRPGVA